jgi:hypothetical protein
MENRPWKSHLRHSKRAPSVRSLWMSRVAMNLRLTICHPMSKLETKKVSRMWMTSWRINFRTKNHQRKTSTPRPKNRSTIYLGTNRPWKRPRLKTKHSMSSLKGNRHLKTMENL